MHKIRIGVMADTAGFHGDADIPQPVCMLAGQANVDGLAFGVVAGSRHALSAFAQHDIGGRRPVAGNDVKGGLGLKFELDGV